MAPRTRLLRLATAGPGDTAALSAAIDAGEVDPAAIVAIIGKTEGNGCVNDFTRGYATLALKLLLAGRLGCALQEIEKRVAIVMSGGTEGGLSPHLLVFSRDAAPVAAAGPRLDDVAQASVVCAERLLAAGQATESAKLYDAVRTASVSEQRKAEATRGLILARGKDGIPLLLETLRSPSRCTPARGCHHRGQR